MGAAVADVVTKAQAGADVSLLDWFKVCRSGTLTTNVWGLGVSVPNNTAKWIPTWPLAEAAGLAYTNAAVKNSATDGLPLGDPYWFTGAVTAVASQVSAVPVAFALEQNYPNPFNPATRIVFSLPKETQARLEIFDMLGRNVATLFNETKHAGQYSVDYDGSKLSSGIYIYRLSTPGMTMSKKMTLLK
jgi:hypothetical protein